MKEKKVIALVAESIRAYRRQRGLTIERLAERAGIDAGFVGHIETQSRAPSLAMLARISAALGVSPGDLLVDPASMSKSSLDRRFQALLKSMEREEKADLLAIMAKRPQGRDLKALRQLLRA